MCPVQHRPRPRLTPLFVLGVLDDGEVITLDIVPLADLWRLTPDGKTLAALYLYEKLVGTGQIKGAPAR